LSVFVLDVTNQSTSPSLTRLTNPFILKFVSVFNPHIQSEDADLKCELSTRNIQWLGVFIL
jgi:hypothetical protein